MIYSDIPSAQTLVLYFQSVGIKNIVISPGSRNAPLTLSFTKNPFFKCFSIVDERCAGFFALGMAQQLNEPVAVVCTSGSALLNYYPAVAESFYSDIPLIVVSADRPSHKIDIGDGQTIRQDNVFKRHIGYSANLKQDVDHARDAILNNGDTQDIIQQYNEKEIELALNIAIMEKTPVHVNIPFEEPLYGVVETPKVEIASARKPVVEDAEIENLEELKSIWNASNRKMVLVGVNSPNTVSDDILDRFANDDSVLVFTETTSNLHHPNFFPSIDSIIAPIEKSDNSDELFKALQPDLLVTFGGLIVSKKIKAFLRKYQPKQHWHIDPQKAYDTFFCLSRHIKQEPNKFFRTLLAETSPSENGYLTKWSKVKESYQQKRVAYLEKVGFSDFTVFDQVQQSIPKGYQVHLANSSTVRYTQLFPMDPSLKIYCNRGTSGIDGSTSTALGGSIYSKTPTLLITGDLSFFYDSNGLWNNYIRPDFRVTIINNSGGGIFRILPGKENTEEFDAFFETTHQFTAGHLAKMYGFSYQKATSEEELKTCLTDFYATSENPKILEVRTPRLENNKILLDYFDFIS
ncbi:2-succinyl-5-enolpyruvyl-6-hydroxy-3-cyclohexene-1-carboxylic-acid synthase [Flagellimonas sp.]|uniref:2-succinyl-5-enolpyruvyl-6-hydroxy-3- cyclohexene-1-carboxylic-acid synthase n=1 Tax=Flagellimonas sp. TaxID=2058762 RepID=UPI003B5A2BBA